MVFSWRKGMNLPLSVLPRLPAKPYISCPSEALLEEGEELLNGVTLI